MDQFTLVSFPEVQEYMEESWFDDEASLADSEKYGYSAYFIPTSRIQSDEDTFSREEVESHLMNCTSELAAELAEANTSSRMKVWNLRVREWIKENL
jgi:hypothetical protein